MKMRPKIKKRKILTRFTTSTLICLNHQAKMPRERFPRSRERFKRRKKSLTKREKNWHWNV